MSKEVRKIANEIYREFLDILDFLKTLEKKLRRVMSRGIGIVITEDKVWITQDHWWRIILKFKDPETDEWKTKDISFRDEIEDTWTSIHPAYLITAIVNLVVNKPKIIHDMWKVIEESKEETRTKTLRELEAKVKAYDEAIELLKQRYPAELVSEELPP